MAERGLYDLEMRKKLYKSNSTCMSYENYVVKIENSVKQVQCISRVKVYLFLKLYLMVGPTLVMICALNSGQNILVWVGMGYMIYDFD